LNDEIEKENNFRKRPKKNWSQPVLTFETCGFNKKILRDEIWKKKRSKNKINISKKNRAQIQHEKKLKSNDER